MNTKLLMSAGLATFLSLSSAHAEDNEWVMWPLPPGHDAGRWDVRGRDGFVSGQIERDKWGNYTFRDREHSVIGTLRARSEKADLYDSRGFYKGSVVPR